MTLKNIKNSEQPILRSSRSSRTRKNTTTHGITKYKAKSFSSSSSSLCELQTKDWNWGTCNVKLDFFHKVPGLPMTNGTGVFGQLGNTRDTVKLPGLVPFFTKNNIKCVQAEAGGLHTAFLTSTGKVYTCGNDDEGVLGRIAAKSNEPDIVQLPEKIIQLACGDSHMLALSVTGKVWQWGLYRDSSSGKYIEGSFDLTQACRPNLRLSLGTYDYIIKVACGDHHSVALSNRGDVYTWGSPEVGVLGRTGHERPYRAARYNFKAKCLRPEKVIFSKNITKMVDIFVGNKTSFAKSSDDTYFGWGANTFAQLGLDELGVVPIPVCLDYLLGLKVKDIQGGNTHTIFLMEDGSVKATGNARNGRLGTSENDKLKELSSHPLIYPGEDYKQYDNLNLNPNGNNILPVSFENGVKIKKIACKSGCSFAIDEKDNLYGWGCGYNEQLGNATGPGPELCPDIFVPKLVKTKSLENKRVQMVSVGGQHTAMISK